jgi:hypothetical protein
VRGGRGAGRLHTQMSQLRLSRGEKVGKTHRRVRYVKARQRGPGGCRTFISTHPSEEIRGRNTHRRIPRRPPPYAATAPSPPRPRAGTRSRAARGPPGVRTGLCLSHRFIGRIAFHAGSARRTKVGGGAGVALGRRRRQGRAARLGGGAAAGLRSRGGAGR